MKSNLSSMVAAEVVMTTSGAAFNDIMTIPGLKWLYSKSQKICTGLCVFLYFDNVALPCGFLVYVIYSSMLYMAGSRAPRQAYSCSYAYKMFSENMCEIGRNLNTTKRIKLVIKLSFVMYCLWFISYCIKLRIWHAYVRFTHKRLRDSSSNIV